jgi:hypothetical protein
VLQTACGLRLRDHQLFRASASFGPLQLGHRANALTTISQHGRRGIDKAGRQMHLLEKAKTAPGA